MIYGLCAYFIYNKAKPTDTLPTDTLDIKSEAEG